MNSIIAAVAQNRAIGYQNKLPWHLPADLRRFKEMTMGKTLIMGRKTFESLPGILPGRKHLVATAGAFPLPPDVERLLELIPFLEKNKNTSEEMFVIGGSSVYTVALPYCDTIYMTCVLKEVQGDVFFPVIPENRFYLAEESEIMRDEASELCFQYKTLKAYDQI